MDTGQIKFESISNKYRDICDYIIKSALQSGATDCIISINNSQEHLISARIGKIDNMDFFNNTQINITYFNNNRKAFVTCNDITKSSIDRSLAYAKNIAKFIESDPDTILADISQYPTEIRDFDNYHPIIIRADNIIEKLLSMESCGLDQTKINNSNGSSFSASQHYHLFSTSRGFCQDSYSTYYSLSSNFIAQDNNSMEQDSDYDVKVRYDDLENHLTIASNAAKGAIKSLNPRTIKTGNYPIILDKKISRWVIKAVLSGLSGSNLYKHSSFLENSMHKKIATEKLTIKEDPFKLRSISSTNFDNDGVATSRKTILDRGIVNNYLLSCYSANKLGLASTGNSGGAYNVSVDHDEMSQIELLAKMGKGILVTNTFGHGPNIINGDYSEGISGFWIENGQIQYPINQLTAATNMSDLLHNIKNIANDSLLKHNINCGSMLIENMMIAGN